MGCVQDDIKLLIPTITDSQHGPGLFVATQPQNKSDFKDRFRDSLWKGTQHFSLEVHERGQITALPSELLVTLTATVPVLMHTLPVVNLNVPAARNRCILETSNVPLGKHLLLYSSEQKQQIPPEEQPCCATPGLALVPSAELHTRDSCNTGKGFPKHGRITAKCGTTQNCCNRELEGKNIFLVNEKLLNSYQSFRILLSSCKTCSTNPSVVYKTPGKMTEQ